MFQLIQALYSALGSFQYRHVPRAPLPDRGVTSCSVMFLHHIGKRYPPFIAHTDSCAKPSSSRRLRLTITAGLCRLSLVPAGRWPFPTLSLQSLRRRLDPLPRSVLLVLLLASSRKITASPQTSQVRHTETVPVKRPGVSNRAILSTPATYSQIYLMSIYLTI